jgi:hypothetical protein
MFRHLRDPGGGASLLMGGLAALALGGFLLLTPLPAPLNLALGGAAGAGGAAAVTAWALRRRAARYDLNRLWEEGAPSREPEEPYEETLAKGEEASPYCGWCDEVYAPGTRRCLRCNREIG